MQICRNLKRTIPWILLIAVIMFRASTGLAQGPTMIKFSDLSEMLHRQNDTTYLFNFWATWCPPCVTEFPELQKFAAENNGRKFKLIFISLDFKKDMHTSVAKFVASHNVREPVYLLDEPDYNAWIDRVDSSWEGNLPASLVINNTAHVHKMFPREFTGTTLHEIIGPFIP
jgi:thiol-disulfide isomerase/thioredoxin